MSFLLNACRGIQHCYNTVDATLCKYLFDSIVVLLRTDKWQEHTFTFNARIAFKYIFGALIERHTKHLRAFPFGFVRDIFNSTVNNAVVGHTHKIRNTTSYKALKNKYVALNSE